MGEVEELALKSKGCVVSYSTSSYGGYDECSNIIDGQRNTYWCTTGLYPQIFIVSFPNPVIVSSIKIRSYLVQLISVEKSSTDTPQQFDDLCEKDLGITDHCHQVESLHDSKFIARHLRFTIKSGYDHICAVYRIEIQGILNKSGEEEIELSNEETNISKNMVPVTSPQGQVGKNSPRARSNEIAHMLNSFQSMQHPSKSNLLGDGSGRLVGQSPRERSSRMTTSMVPPLWNEEDEEGEETNSPIEITNRMIPHESDVSSDEDANH